MSQEDSQPDPWTPERQELRQWLGDYAPALAEPYEAAVRLLSTPGFPARRHLLGHLVREIANGLPEVVTGRRVNKRFDATKALNELADAWPFLDVPAFSERESPAAPSTNVSTSLVHQVSRLIRDHRAVKQTKRDKTASLMDALRPGTMELRQALEPVIREWAEVVAWFESQTHVPRDGTPRKADEAELQRQFQHFEDGLLGITQGHFQVVKEIDSLLESSVPSADALDRIMPFLGGAEQLRYFFTHPRLEDPNWLRLLDESGFFKQPPEPLADREKGTETHVRWPASGYLARMATYGDAQEAVTAIASKLRTANTLVRDDLIDLARQLPPVLGAKLVPTLLWNLKQTRWSRAPVEKLGALTDTLAQSGQVPAATTLLESLVSVVRDPRARQTDGYALSLTPRLLVNVRDLERTLDQHLPGIVRGLGLQSLEVFNLALDRAVRLSRDGSADGIEDHSHIWRPRIESGDDDDVYEILASVTLRAAEQLISRVPSDVVAVLDTLGTRRWPVFTRIELYLLASAPVPPPDRVSRYLLDRVLFDRVSTRREYRMLLKSTFGVLTDDQRTEWLGWVQAGLPSDRVRESLQLWGGSASEEEVARQGRRWQWEQLSPVHDVLPASWQPRWLALHREFGEPKPVDNVDRPGFSVSTGWESPIGEQDLADLSVDKLVAFLKSPSFPRDRPFSSPEGLRELITRVVARAPQRYAERAHAFEGLAPTYVRGVLGGLAAASKDRVPFDWDQVLGLAGWVLKQPVTEPEPDWNLREDSGWAWTRGTIIRLLEDGLKKDPSPLPATARTAVWNLIEPLCHDPNPRCHADAVAAALEYASWVYVHQGRPWSGRGTLDDAPEVRKVLDDAADLGAAPSTVVYETLGHWLPWLVFMDEPWVRSNLNRIFPVDHEHVSYRRAAWQAFLQSGASTKDRVFDVLRSVYEAAVDQLDPHDEAASSLGRPEQCLADDLAVLYGRGTLEARNASSLLDRFLQKASPSLRRHFFWYVGHSLQEQPEPVPGDVLQRFQTLWQARRQRSQTDPLVQEDLESFGMWFACGRFDDDWALEQLEYILRERRAIEHAHLVVERLAFLAPGRTSAVMRCFGPLVTNLREPGPVHGWLDRTKVILGAALRSSDADTRSQAIEVFHKLGTLGFREHDVVPFSDDLEDPAAIAYFTWDHPMTVAEVRARLNEASPPERNRLLGQILRQAKDTDVWRFTSPQQVAERWPQLERHLGKRRAFWQLLLEQWREQGMLAR